MTAPRFRESNATTGSFSVDLKGRTALVTGASSGLGRHFAETLARSGATVALVARRMEALEEVRSGIEATGGSAHCFAADVTDGKAVAQTVDAVGKALNGIDILINNAGVTITRSFLDMEESDWDRVIDTDLTGCFLVGQAVARAMRDQRRGGSIVNIASILALRVAGQLSAYAAAKAGLAQLTRTMALELARWDIRVNALCPGYLETDLNRDFFATDAGQALVKRIPMRRLGRPDELDGMLLLLCSDAASYTTGSVIAVDGGHSNSGL